MPYRQVPLARSQGPSAAINYARLVPQVGGESREDREARARMEAATRVSDLELKVHAGINAERASNCVGCQERWAISAGHEPRHVELFLTMAFRMVSSLRMQATKATFFALPAASSLW